MSITVFAPATAATKLLLATVNVTFGLSTDTEAREMSMTPLLLSCETT